MLRSESAIETRARSTARINQSAINAASPALGIDLSTSSSAFGTPSESLSQQTPTLLPLLLLRQMDQLQLRFHLLKKWILSMMQSLLSSNFRNNLSQISSPAQVVPTTLLRQVPQSEYITTSTAQSKLIEVIKFSNNGTSNREMLKQLNVMTSDCSLLLSLMDRVGNPYIRLKTSLVTLRTLWDELDSIPFWFPKMTYSGISTTAVDCLQSCSQSSRKSSCI